MKPTRVWFHVPLLLLFLIPVAQGGEPPIHMLSGTVLGDDGKPAAGAKVAVTIQDDETHFWGDINYRSFDELDVSIQQDYWGGFVPVKNTRNGGLSLTDAKGQFKIEQLKAGRYLVLAVHPVRGVTATDFSYDPSQHQPLNIQLEPAAYIYGTLEGGLKDGFYYLNSLTKPDVQGEPRVENSFTRYTSLCNLHMLGQFSEDGKFCLGPLPSPAYYTIDVGNYETSRGFLIPRIKQTCLVEKGEHLCITPKPESMVEGRILGPEGEPLKSVSVTLRHPALSDKTASQMRFSYSGISFGSAVRGTVTDADGKFMIPVYVDQDVTLFAKRWCKRSSFG